MQSRRIVRLAPTLDEMVTDCEEQKAGNRFYKAQSGEYSKQKLSALVARTASELAGAAEREQVRLDDIDAVKRQATLYLSACEKAGAFPSVSGLARALGFTRRVLYNEIDKQTPVGKYLEVLRDAFSDVLAEASLFNNCNSIVAIFLQKALYGLHETVRIEAVAPPVLGDGANPQELLSRYQ